MELYEDDDIIRGLDIDIWIYGYELIYFKYF